MMRTLASGAASATAVARSRTMEALVLKRSRPFSLTPTRANILTITGHAWLAGDTGRNDDNLGTSECLSEGRGRLVVASDGAGGVYVSHISGDTYLRSIDVHI
jgi:hypothetical protein